MAEYHRAGGMRGTDQELKGDLLYILPAEHRKMLLWHSKDGGPFYVFRDMVTTQSAKILMNRQKLSFHAVDAEPVNREAGTRPGLAAEEEESWQPSCDDFIAAFRFGKGKGKGKGKSSGAGGAAGAQRPRKRPNSGE